MNKDLILISCYLFFFVHSSTETDIEDALKEAGGPMDEGISDIAKDSHFIINPSKASQEQARYLCSKVCKITIFFLILVIRYCRKIFV